MANSDWLVREATLADLGSCAELAAARQGGPSDSWERLFTSLLTIEQAVMYVGVAAGSVVAYGRAQLLTDDVMSATPALPSGFYLLGVNVDPGSRRRGIASALCQKRVAWAHQFSEDCWFFTNVNNSASRALHTAVGFTEIAEFRSAQLDGGVGVLGNHCVE